MADRNVDIELKIKGDTKEVVKTQGALARLGGFINNIQAGIGKMMAAFGMFGLAVNGINHLIDAYKKLIEHVNSADKSVKSFFKKNVLDPFINRFQDANEEAKRFANTLEAVGKNAGDMTEKHARASVEAKVLFQTKAMKLSENRAFEDAKLALDEQRELAGAADAEQEQAVRDKYEHKRITLTQTRTQEDARATRAEANAEVIRKNDEARKWEAMQRNVERTIKQLADEIAEAEKNGTQAQVDALKETLKAAEAQSEDFGRKGGRARFEARMAGVVSNEQEIVERTANVKAEAERKRIETERKNQKAEAEAELRQKLKEEEMRLEVEIYKNEGEIGSIVAKTGPQGALKAQDRISAMGGFASASAASLTGVGVMPQQNKEINRLTNIVQSLKTELENIRDCIKESNSRFS